MSSCEKPKKCVHCGGGHEAGSKDCAVNKEYQKINELMVHQKLSRQEAKIRVRPRETGYRQTDAQAVGARVHPSTNTLGEDRDDVKKLNAKLDRVLEEREKDVTVRALSVKLDMLLQAQGNVAGSNATEDDVDLKIRKAITESEKKFGSSIKNLQDQIDEQKETITNLTAENQQLREEAKTLHDQIDSVTTARDQALKELAEMRAEQSKKRKGSDTGSTDRPAPKDRKTGQSNLPKSIEKKPKKTKDSNKPETVQRSLSQSAIKDGNLPPNKG